MLAALGHVASRAQILDGGIEPRALASAVGTGRLRRIGRGWYADREATREQVVAVRVGGVLGGPSAAVSYGMWVPQGLPVHVSLARNVSRLRPAPAGERIRLDWSRPAGGIAGAGPQWRVDPVLAVRQSASVLKRDHLVALIDSALHSGLVTGRAIEAIVPADVIRRVDPAAESGIESLVRVRLADLGLPVRPQVVVPGVGRLDLVVGDRLVIETDGRAHHGVERFEADRARDLELAARDLVVLRLSYRQVMHDWAAVEDAVLRVIERRGHLARHPFLRSG